MMKNEAMPYERVLTFLAVHLQDMWKKDPSFDNLIRRDFEVDIQRAVRGELDSWLTTPRGYLGYVVLLDQFSRNAFRDTPAAFAQDSLALAASLKAQALGYDQALTPTERQFLYMPMMHAEDRPLQKRCVDAFTVLAQDNSEESRSALDYARRHQAIIEQFGRFPHRNTILGRKSTPEEIAFLKIPGSSF